MPKEHKRILLPILIVLVATVGVLAFIRKRPRAVTGFPRNSAPSAQTSTATRAARNLSLQPEAFNLGRRLGQRFSSRTRELSTFTGILTVGTNQTLVTTVRGQTANGERVEIYVASSPTAFTWDANQGALVGTSRATGSDRDLIERLVFDSPDQFLLAQLRGASYYTIARNARPTSAPDNYAGPLWNVVRLDDPERDPQIRPRSPWRIYYINTTTGLIDKTVCQVDGDTIEAVFAGWVEISGEKVPGEITWLRRGELLMQYQLTNFSHVQQ